MKKYLLLFIALLAALPAYALDSKRVTSASVYDYVLYSTTVHYTVWWPAGFPNATYYIGMGAEPSTEWFPNLHGVTLGGTSAGSISGTFLFVSPDPARVAGVDASGTHNYAADWIENGNGINIGCSSSGHTQLTWLSTTDDSSPPTEANKDVNIDIVITGASVNHKTAVFDMKGASNDGKTHTVQLKYNGSVVATMTVGAGPVGGTKMLSETHYTQNAAVAGDIYSYVVDGVAGGGGVVPAFAEGSLSYTAPEMDASWTGTKPSPTPPGSTPTPTQQGGGNTTSQDNSGGTMSPPTTIVNNPTTTISGTSGGATNEDIYNDVLRANIDAGNSTSPGTFPKSLAMGDQIPGLDTNLEDTKTKVTETIASAGNYIDSASSQFNPATKKITMPSVSGSKLIYTWNMHYLGDITVDLNPYATVISYWRNLCLMFVTIAFWFYAVKAIRSAIA